MLMRYTDKSELKDMVTSSPMTSVFLAPTVTRDGTRWSFLIHEDHEVIESLDKGEGAADGDSVQPDARCMLITVSSNRTRIHILVFLLRFESEEPLYYSLLLNPADSSTREVLEDLALQNKLVVDFFDEDHVSRLIRDNPLYECIRDTTMSLADESPVEEETFRLIVECVMPDYADLASLWELSNIDSGKPGCQG